MCTLKPSNSLTLEPSPLIMSCVKVTRQPGRGDPGWLIAFCYNAAIILLNCSVSSNQVQEICANLVCICCISFPIPFSWCLIEKNHLQWSLKNFAYQRANGGFGLPHTDKPAANSAVQDQGLCYQSHSVQRCVSCCVQQGTFVMSTLSLVLFRCISQNRKKPQSHKSLLVKTRTVCSA